MVDYGYIARWKNEEKECIEYHFHILATNDNRSHMHAMREVEYFSYKMQDVLKYFDYVGAEIVSINGKEV